MLCCIGLFAGAAVGQYLGGPWTYIGPIAGFGVGFAADMKFMKGCHMGGHRHTTSDTQKDVDAKAAPATKGLDAVASPAMTSTDPVCGMEVDGSKAEHRVEHLGKTYYFCAPGCKKSFEENPESYVGIGQAQQAA